MSAESEEHTVHSADGTKIGFVRLGSGPSLVLVHGGVNTRDAWLPVATVIANQFTCYVMDRRGRGRSGDGPEHSLDRECEDIKAVLDFAGPGAHLLGHSYGAICALEAACRFPVGRLVLYEPPLFDGENRSFVGTSTKNTDDIDRHGISATRSGSNTGPLVYFSSHEARVR